MLQKESKRLIYKQILIIHGPFKSIHLILERKCHVSQIYLFNEVFEKELPKKCNKIYRKHGEKAESKHGFGQT